MGTGDVEHDRKAAVNVDPIGLPAALKAWRLREPEPVLTIHCRAEADCGAVVGAAYRTPQGTVVESRISVPEPMEPPTEFELSGGGGAFAKFAEGLGITGMLDDFDLPDDQPAELEPRPESESSEPQESFRAQIDLLYTDIYWHDPKPLCPAHGELRVDQASLVDAVNQRRASYDARP